MGDTRYTFVHITKCGGTAVENYFGKYCSKYIRGRDHHIVCNLHNNPIVIVRDPVDRFLSMYKYWKNGATSGPYTRNEAFRDKYRSVTIKDFIKMLEENKVDDLHQMTTRKHFQPQTLWIPKNTYSNTIVVCYTKDLNGKIRNLLQYLSIPCTDTDLPFVNVSRQDDLAGDVVLDEDDMKFLKQRFADDFILWDQLHSSAELFKHVI